MNRRRFLAQSSLSALALRSSSLPEAPSLLAAGRFAAAPVPEAESILAQVRAGRPLQGMDVIDTHAHFDVISGALIHPLSVEMLEDDSRRAGISLTIVSPFEGYMATTAGQLKAAHDSCVEAAAKYRDSLRAYLVFQPHLLKASVAEMQRALEPESPFVGFKLHGAVDQYAADGPNYQPVFEFANEHRMHVLYHVWGGIRGVGVVAEKYPRMTLTIAHMAFWTGATVSEIIALLREHPNLSSDTCASTWPYRHLERYVEALGAERFLFATDATYLALGPQVAKVALAMISDDQKRLIFGGNARRIFGSRLPARN
jgi:uncharacterized protein